MLGGAIYLNARQMAKVSVCIPSQIGLIKIYVLLQKASSKKSKNRLITVFEPENIANESDNVIAECDSIFLLTEGMLLTLLSQYNCSARIWFWIPQDMGERGIR